jgi:hypothetical protein
VSLKSPLTVRADDSDLTLRSSDGILFKVHRRNLFAYSEAFDAGSSFKDTGEIVELSENSATLELLLQYIYPKPPPNLENLSARSLVRLAEAAEKYLFHSVIQTCKFHMKYVVNCCISAESSTEPLMQVVGYTKTSGYFGVCFTARICGSHGSRR